ncbi:MAG TPA: secretin N-terminal domain-containing protein [Thermoanaerobaculia bacterium]|nr:secretin N-terminal domain-containing protein [Thermoanaerobaculia bacterium]
MKKLAVLALALMLLGTAAFADTADAGRSLSVRTFTFKYKQAETAATAVKKLMSADGSLAMQPGANSLVITDRPENMKSIAQALAEFDVPPQTFHLNVRLVSAARGAEAKISDSLKDVAPKLAMLRYNNLESVGSANVQGREGEPGMVDLGTFRADFSFGEYDAASDSIKLSDFKLSRLEKDTLSPLMKTTLNLKLGQTVIIGAQKDPNSQKALMIVVMAKR